MRIQNRRRTKWAGLVIAALLLATANLAGASTIGFLPSDQTIGFGDTTSVEIEISALAGEIVSAYDLDITYDPSVVSATNVSFTSNLGDEILFEVLNAFDLSTPGIVDLAQVSLLLDSELLALQGGDLVVVASIGFRAVGLGVSALGFVLDAVNDVKGAGGLILPIYPVSGRITVVPEPTVALLIGLGLGLTALTGAVCRRERVARAHRGLRGSGSP